MKFTYAGKGIDITDSIRARLEKKLGKLDRYFRDDVESIIRLRVEKAAQNICEITISVGGILLRAEEVSPDMYQSIDRTVDKLERQIRRYRTRLEKRLRPAEFDDIPASPEEEPVRYEIARVKKFAMKPMDTSDAIAQMELLGHSFFLFVNAETGESSVVYKRNDGSYGLLVAEK